MRAIRDLTEEEESKILSAVFGWRVDSRIVEARVFRSPTFENYVLIGLDKDGEIVGEIGCDGGEPEDQSLVRDWDWVRGVIDGLLRERETK